ncbi:MAG: glycosyltransferase [Pyrinomonadaceae bacterium]
MDHLRRLSVIIPTHRRPRQLAACLEALARQDYPRDRFEVVVVDDGGHTPRGVVEPFAARLNLNFFAQTRTGPGLARNAGAGRAAGEFLVFTDDDCAPAPDWLRRLEARLAAEPERMIGGRTLNALPGNVCSTASQTLIDYLYGYYNSDPRAAAFFASNNIALSARLFRELGGFIPEFHLAAGEDRDLCSRWRTRGHEMTYAPEAVLGHAHPLTLGKFWQQHFNYGRGAYRFHLARARRGEGRIRVEPLSFYVNLLLHPFRTRNGSLPVALAHAALLFLSQAANAAGFFYERSCLDGVVVHSPTRGGKESPPG